MAPMSDEDAAAFDGEHDALTALRATSEGRQVLAHVEAVVAGAASTAWAIAGPVAKAGGQALITALANFAAASLEAQLNKLAK